MATIIISLLIAAAFLFAVRRIRRKGTCGCSGSEGSCSGCASEGGCPGCATNTGTNGG